MPTKRNVQIQTNLGRAAQPAPSQTTITTTEDQNTRAIAETFKKIPIEQ